MLALFLYELKYYFKNLKEAIYIYGLFLSIILLAPFAIPEGSIPLPILAPTILWLALATSISLGGVSLFERDSGQGRLEYYQLLPTSLEQLLLAKWAAFYLLAATPLLAAIPVAGLLLNLPPASWLHHAAGLAAGAGALTLITALAGAILTGLEKAGAILCLIVLPLSIPVLIFGTYFSAHWQAGISQPSLVFLLGFTAFLVPIYSFAAASCIRAAN